MGPAADKACMREEPEEKQADSATLRSFIAKYLQEPDLPPEPERTVLGSRLNLTESGSALERLLPTPSTRLRVMKSRLHAEIEALEAQISNYAGLTNPSFMALHKRNSLTERLNRLKQTEARVQQSLEALQPLPWLMPAQQWVSGILRRWVRQPMETADTLRQMVALMEQAQQSGASSEETSDLLNQFEKAVAQAQKQLASKQPPIKKP